MASQEAWDYAQPRSTELIRQWAIWMVVWTPLVIWRWGLDGSVLITNGLMTAGILLPLWYVERELKYPRFVRRVRCTVLAGASLRLLCFGSRCSAGKPPAHPQNATNGSRR